MESLVTIENRIFLIRGKKVMIDMDLADLYGVTTKALNQAVKRNQGRFPQDFYFQLSNQEKLEVVTICDHLKKLKFSPQLPFAFSEHGALMAASILSSQKAIDASLFVIRTFVKLREMISAHRELSHKLSELEKKVRGHDHHIQSLIEAIRQLMNPPISQKRRIGF